jgi:pyruvate dehydrogenase phosphatase
MNSLTFRFTSLDHNICFGPLEHLPKPQAADVAVTEGPTPAQTFIALAKPAVAGACAISALVDSTTDGLYVASAGDCRGVAGWQREDGTWRCDILSEDQMGENPKEIERYVEAKTGANDRMRSEHPASERDQVIRRGRVFGGLQPTRAFGDAVYKWNLEQGNA